MTEIHPDNHTHGPRQGHRCPYPACVDTPRRRSFVLPLVAVAIAFATVPEPVCAADSDLWRERIMATMVFKFIHYIEWPAPAGGQHVPETITVGVFGAGSVQKTISGFNGRSIDGHSLTIRHVTDPADIVDCHVVFVTQTSGYSIDQIVAAMPDSPVILVGNETGFADSGGIINFFTDDHDRVQFEINVHAAESRGLEISSRLLKLARRVLRNKP